MLWEYGGAVVGITRGGGGSGFCFERFWRMQKKAPRMMVLKRIAPPTAIPAMAAPDIFEAPEIADGFALLLCVSAGIARVGVRAATVAFWLK